MGSASLSKRLRNEGSATDQVKIGVRNINDPPSCDLAWACCPDSKIKNNNGCTLWPPNHKLIAVSIEGVMDADSNYSEVTLQITGVTQDEPLNGVGGGDSSPDAAKLYLPGWLPIVAMCAPTSTWPSGGPSRNRGSPSPILSGIRT